MDDEIVDIVRREQQIGTEGRAMRADDDLIAFRSFARGEMPALVEFAIVRQMDFRHDAEKTPAMNSERAIIEPAAMPQRRADENERHQRLRRRDEMIDSRNDAREQRLLQQQIVDRVTRERQFRKGRNRHRLLMQGRKKRDGSFALVMGSAKWPRSAQAATRAKPCR